MAGELSVLRVKNKRRACVEVSGKNLLRDESFRSALEVSLERTRAVLEDLRAKKLPMIPQCPFVAQYIYRHPEWADVVLKEVPAK